MFQLFGIILAIAMTATMALGSLYYGGAAFAEGSARAQAAQAAHGSTVETGAPRIWVTGDAIE
jgi:hypothetical protein